MKTKTATLTFCLMVGTTSAFAHGASHTISVQGFATAGTAYLAERLAIAQVAATCRDRYRGTLLGTPHVSVSGAHASYRANAFGTCRINSP